MAKETLADRVQRLRGTAGLTARGLAALAGIAASHVSLIERGNRPRVEARTVSLLASVLGCSIDWLYTGVGDEPSHGEVRAAVARAKRAVARTGTDG